MGIAGASVASFAALAPFLIWDGGRRLWECTIVFNRFYWASASFGPSGLWGWLRAFWVDWWILFLLPGLLFIRPGRRSWFWIVMFLAGWVSTGATAFGQYYVVVMPFWALLVAVAINELAPLAAAQLGLPHPWVRRFVVAVVMLLVCLPDLPWATCAKQQFAAERASGGNAFLESSAVARRLAELTSPNDAVFIGGSEPQILYYANRLSPTRFVIVYPLVIPTPLAAKYQLEAIRDLEQRPPEVIIMARSPLSWLTQKGSPVEFTDYLVKLLADHYQPVGGWVGDGQNGRWVEPLSPEDRAGCSLVLFRRNRTRSASDYSPSGGPRVAGFHLTAAWTLAACPDARLSARYGPDVSTTRSVPGGPDLSRSLSLHCGLCPAIASSACWTLG